MVNLKISFFKVKLFFLFLFLSFLTFYFFFDTGSHYVAQAALELTIDQAGWDSRPEPPNFSSMFFKKCLIQKRGKGREKGKKGGKEGRREE